MRLAADRWLIRNREHGYVVADAVAGAVAPTRGNMPDVSQTVGVSCEDACQQCEIIAADFGGGTCQCFANCVQGTNTTICPGSAAGWNSATVSSPTEQWAAHCNAGHRNCTQSCLSHEFMESIRRCRDSGDSAVCFNTMRQHYRPPSADVREDMNHVFCTLPEFSGCERFPSATQRHILAEYSCFDTPEECDASKRSVEETAQPETRERVTSIWSSVRGSLR